MSFVGEETQAEEDAAVRRFIVARDAGDRVAAAAAWEALIVREERRIRVYIMGWRDANGDRLPASEREAVFARTLTRASTGMFKASNFRDVRTSGQLRAWLKTCVGYAAHDQYRSWMRHEKHAAGSIDEPAGEDGTGSRYESVLIDGAASPERYLEKSVAHDAVHTGLAKVPNDKQRKVLEMDLLGVPDDEIAAALDVNVGYVYQLRRRGLMKLKEVLGDVDC